MRFMDKFKSCVLQHPKLSVSLMGISFVQAWDLWAAGRLMEFMDPSLHREPRKAEIMRWVQIGLLCVHEHPEDRPSKWDVVLMLGCENAILREPGLPAYY